MSTGTQVHDREDDIEARERYAPATRGSGPSKHVGEKFTPSGDFREFRGGTVISFLPGDSRAFGLTQSIKERYREFSFSYKLSFLPPSSFHMTAFVVFNDEDRQKAGWSTLIAAETELDSIHAFMYERIHAVPVPQSILMEATRVNGCSVQLVPANDATEKALRSYRDELSLATGIRFADHETYRYHISYAYVIEFLNDSEVDELVGENRRLTRTFRRQSPIIHLPAPQYARFRDMSHFEAYVSDPDRLTSHAQELLSPESSEVIVSPISCAEIACGVACGTRMGLRGQGEAYQDEVTMHLQDDIL